MILQGRAWVYGDDVSTDDIVPGKYLKLTTKEIAPHVLEDLDPTFAARLQPGDILVAGRNCGKGSSRDSAPGALKEAGIAAVVALSFARIFFRNCINLGLPALECADATAVQNGDELRIDVASGRIENLTRGTHYPSPPLPGQLLNLLEQGGLVPYLERWVAERRK